MLLQTFTIMGRSINHFELRDADVVLRPGWPACRAPISAPARGPLRPAGRWRGTLLPELKARIAALSH